jgi:Uma2 family endonuclease
VSTAKRLHYTYEEYLTLLEQSTLKLEYCDGVIYAMARGTLAHAALAAAMIAHLRQSLAGTCSVFTSDLKVRIEATDLATFPDVSVVCGPAETSPRDAHALTNPTFLVEVTSRSTEDYDRGDKLSHYKQLPSLRAVLFVSHREARITLVERAAHGSAWEERDARAGAVLVMKSSPMTIPVDAIYAGVTLDPA